MFVTPLLFVRLSQFYKHLSNKRCFWYRGSRVPLTTAPSKIGSDNL
jgi:hypothetical protein